MQNALYQLIVDIGGFAQEKTLYDFFIPPLLTILYLPFIFALLVYMSYEDAMLRVNFSIENKWHRTFAKFLVMVAFNVRLELLERWRSSLHMNNIQSFRDVWNSVVKIFRMRTMERNPKPVDIKDGWSPYEAKDVLSSLVFKAGYYKELFDGEWHASSPYVEIGDGAIPNNIAYYLDGDDHAARVLKLNMHINEVSNAPEAHERFCEAGVALFEYATKTNAPKWLSDSLIQGLDAEATIGNVNVYVEKEEFPNKRRNGYSVKLSMNHTSKLY